MTSLYVSVSHHFSIFFSPFCLSLFLSTFLLPPPHFFCLWYTMCTPQQLLPQLAVACVISALGRLIPFSSVRFIMLATLCLDLMTAQFLFAIRNEGSWQVWVLSVSAFPFLFLPFLLLPFASTLGAVSPNTLFLLGYRHQHLTFYYYHLI